MDNIADDAKIPAQETDDEYMKKFDVVRKQLDENGTIISQLYVQPDQDHRIAVMREFLQGQQAYNEQVYDLLVEMSNFFSSLIPPQ